MKMALSLYMRSAEEWRGWLVHNHALAKEVWLIFYKTGSTLPCITYDESLDEALCYGWIDSLIQKIDEERYARKFTPRTNTAKWSVSNKRRAARLIREGRMTEMGLAKIGDLSDFREDLIDERPKTLEIPEIVARGLQTSAAAWDFFNSLPPSQRKRYVGWIMSAKRIETVQKRILEAIVLLEKEQPLVLK